nr:phospholipid--sterol O-acyltransferase isoform X2 [Ipomoea batatas]
MVWLDTTKLLSDVYCRLMCMLLNPYNQTNHPECKSHPDSGLSAIAKLDPGYIIAQLSSVWKEWIKWCIEFGVDAHAITAVQYDWRLQPSKLEERDLYFHKLKLSLLTFETSLKHHGGQQIVFAHSLGVEDLGGMVELVEGSVVDLDGIDVTKVGVAVYAEFCRDWGEALRMYDGAYHVLREMATSWCTDKMESSLIAMLKVVGLVAVVVKSLIDVLFGIGTDLYTGEQKNDDDPFANVSFRSNNGILGSSPKEKDVPQMVVYHVDSKFNEHDIPYVVLWLAFEHTDGRHYFTWDKMFPNSEEMQEWLIAKGKKMVSFGGFLSMEKHFSIRNSIQSTS